MCEREREAREREWRDREAREGEAREIQQVASPSTSLSGPTPYILSSEFGVEETGIWGSGLRGLGFGVQNVGGLRGQGFRVSGLRDLDLGSRGSG